MSLRRRHFEVASSGVDETLQLVGSDGSGSLSWAGLRVPFLPTPGAAPELRYLFNLASFQVGDGARVRIKGWRQSWSLGTRITVPQNVGQPLVRVIEQVVEDPFFKFPDGNVTFHLQVIDQAGEEGQVFRKGPGPVAPPMRDLAFRMSDNPALLYEAATPAPNDPFYVNLAAYTPPNAGRPWGVPLDADLGVVHDLRTDWRSHGGWHSLDIPVDGAATVALFASVKQTNPESPVRALDLVGLGAVPNPNGGGAPFFSEGLSPEEQFLLNFPFVESRTFSSTGAIIWRVAGALIVALDE